MGSSSSVPALKAMATPIPGGANAVMGYWFVQGVVPTIFETNAYNSLEHYEWLDQPAGKLRVTFKYRSGDYDGVKGKMSSESTVLQDGNVVNVATGAEWRVRPRLGGCPMPVSLPYIILQADPASHMVVGYPDRSYLWIMSRMPKMDEELYAGLVKQSVEEWGYDVEKIQRVRQFWDDKDFPASPMAAE
jgi:apolipoprotein D and lipocalin family protein